MIRFATRKAFPLALFVALALAGCGRRGELEPPIDAKATAQPATTADNGEPQVRKKIPPITPPKTPFILDPLLADTPTK